MEKSKKTVAIKVDTSSIESIRDTATGIIYVEAEGIKFPDGKWNDFIVIILGWWVAKIIDLLNGSSTVAKCTFMDGAFEFSLQNTGYGYLLKLYDTDNMGIFHEMDIDLNEFINSLKASIKTVLEFCDGKGWVTDDLLKLKGKNMELINVMNSRRL